MDIRRRLESLKEEVVKGQRILAELEVRRRNTLDQMLRISGAIQVLEETLNECCEPASIPANAGD